MFLYRGVVDMRKKKGSVTLALWVCCEKQVRFAREGGHAFSKMNELHGSEAMSQDGGLNLKYFRVILFRVRA